MLLKTNLIYSQHSVQPDDDGKLSISDNCLPGLEVYASFVVSLTLSAEKKKL